MKAPIRVLVLVLAALALANGILVAQDPSCFKRTGFTPKDRSGTRYGCGAENGCYWVECWYGSNEQGSPGNYRDDCSGPVECGWSAE